MPCIHDVVHLRVVVELLADCLVPLEIEQLVIYALDQDLVECVRHVGQHSLLDEDRLLCCAAAYGCKRACMRLLNASQLAQYATCEQLLRQPIDLLGPLPDVYEFPSGVLYEAAKRGDLDAISWLHPVTLYEPHEAMLYAASNGFLDVALWIGAMSMTARITTKRVYELEMHALDDPEGVAALTWVVHCYNTRYARVYRKFLATRHGVGPVERGMGRADAHTYTGAMDFVSGLGDLQLVQAMHDDQDYAWSCTAGAMDNAARGGHLDVLTWLHTHRSEGCTSLAMEHAAMHGRLAVLSWLRAHRGLTPTVATLRAALRGGHVDVLKWIHVENPSIALSSVLIDAACESSNRLEVLQWLEKTMGIDQIPQHAITLALEHGDKPAVQWLVERYDKRKSFSSWNTVLAKWMSYELGLARNGSFVRTALEGHLDMVAWMGQSGRLYKVEVDTLWQCAVRGHLDIVAYLLQHQTHLPRGVEVAPSHWTSFQDAIKEDHGGRNIGSRFEAAPFVVEPVWARSYVNLWLQYHPEPCKGVSWLATWAIKRGYTDMMDKLASLA